jgi:hypothetical protein
VKASRVDALNKIDAAKNYLMKFYEDLR